MMQFELLRHQSTCMISEALPHELAYPTIVEIWRSAGDVLCLAVIDGKDRTPGEVSSRIDLDDGR